MQKVQSYLYPNRVILLADLAGFNVENTIVYARTVKLYKGVDNVIEFDIQNADQKRLDLVTSSPVTGIRMNVMDQSGNALPNSPYVVTPTSIKGVASTIIPSTDLTGINHQSLRYSVTATDTNGNHIPLYNDSRFSAVGTMEVVESATPVTKPSRVYDEFAGEINFKGNVINHSPAIATKFYEAVATTTMSFDIYLNNFVGQLYLEGTEDMTISVNSYLNATQIQTYSTTVPVTTTIHFANVPINTYNYFRVSWVYPDIWQFGSQQNATAFFGEVTKIVVTP